MSNLPFASIRINEHESLSDKFLGKISNPNIILVIWFGLFILTILSTNMEMRSLASAFIAWLGGLVTARLDYIIREERNRKNNARIF